MSGQSAGGDVLYYREILRWIAHGPRCRYGRGWNTMRG